MPSDPQPLSLDEVRHLAVLARIDLDDAHLARLAGQLDQILHAVARVTEVATEDVPATSHPLPLANVFRTDVVQPSLPVEEALAAAPAVEEQRFRVPRILDEEA
jgi:aspartyl-tRNA(Asn)/glutamyl-tRNA(Gln) amidotransferase subunit C